MWMWSGACLHALKWGGQGPDGTRAWGWPDWSSMGPSCPNKQGCIRIMALEAWSMGTFPAAPVVRCPGAPRPPGMVKLEHGQVQQQGCEMAAPLTPALNGNRTLLPVSICSQKNPLTAKFLWSNSDTLWVHFKWASYGNGLSPLPLLVQKPGSLNSSDILSHLLSASLDLTAKQLMDGRAAHKVLCQGLARKFS